MHRRHVIQADIAERINSSVQGDYDKIDVGDDWASSKGEEEEEKVETTEI